MVTSVALNYYNVFKKAVHKRTTHQFAVPLSGGLDSTLIAKAIIDLGIKDQCKFICMYKNEYTQQVADKYGLTVTYYEPQIDNFEKFLYTIIEIWEEPWYAVSVGYFLYQEIEKLGCRVSLSGLGSDELYGGYDYYDTLNYPRGLFKEIKAVSNFEKLKWDKKLLIEHHLRKNDKLGLKFKVEGRYPFLDRELTSFTQFNFKKQLIKEILLEDFGSNFVYRKKTGFILPWEDNAVLDKHVDLLKKRGYTFTINNKKQKMFYCQLNIWLDIFNSKI